MAKSGLSIEEIEKLGFYDFMSYLGLPFWHIGGLKSSLDLARLCHIKRKKKVLMVGCGTGLSACFLAKKLGCDVVGIDLAKVSIGMAKERAKEELIENKVIFQVADATNLPFETNTFDAVITEFVAMLLDKTKAFMEFARVLKPGGFVGINELFIRSQDIPSHLADEILKGIELYKEVIKLDFKPCSREEWQEWLEKGGLKNIQIDQYSKYVSIRELPEYNDLVSIDELPEYNDYISVKNFPRIIMVFRNLIMFLSLGFNRRMIKYFILSKKVRDRLKKVRVMKKTFFKNRTSSRYIGCILGVGQKK